MRSEKDQQRKLLKAIEKEYIKFLQTLGNEAAKEAQKLVPVVTGQLRKSFSVRNISDGVEIKYDAPYAYDVHEGKNTEQLTEPWVSSIPKHKRKLQSGKIVNVKKHTKTYKTGYKPVQVSGGWSAINVNEYEREAHQWMQDAWRIVYKKQDKDVRQIIPNTLNIQQGHS